MTEQGVTLTGGPMKKLSIVSVVIAVALLFTGVFARAYSQNTSTDNTPTFYRLVPGTYVNPWPRFTVTYPKDWVERRPPHPALFRATPPGEPTEKGLAVFIYTGPAPIEKYADVAVATGRALGGDVILVSDKPSRLHDGTPVREVVTKAVRNALSQNVIGLAAKKGDVQIYWSVMRINGEVGEDLKTVLYSLQFQPGKDEPVKVPPDIQAFLDRFSSDLVSHDIAKVMSHYSDRYLDSGNRKGEAERIWTAGVRPMTSFETGVTELVTEGDRAYLAGFWIGYWGKMMLMGTSIIKENGEWKWYGNQRNPAP
jgi:hypothetical protein